MVHSTEKKGEKLGVAEAGIQSFFLCTVCLMKVLLYVQNTQPKRCTLFVSVVK